LLPRIGTPCHFGRVENVTVLVNDLDHHVILCTPCCEHLDAFGARGEGQSQQTDRVSKPATPGRVSGHRDSPHRQHLPRVRVQVGQGSGSQFKPRQKDLPVTGTGSEAKDRQSGHRPRLYAPRVAAQCSSRWRVNEEDVEFGEPLGVARQVYRRVTFCPAGGLLPSDELRVLFERLCALAQSCTRSRRPSRRRDTWVGWWPNIQLVSPGQRT
jgi:hypothetical protein